MSVQLIQQKLITGTCCMMNMQFMPGCDKATGQPRPKPILGPLW